MKQRVDIVGLTTNPKPVNSIEDGSTFYCVDNGDLYVFYNGQWYLQDFVEPIENNDDTRTINERIEVEEIKNVEETKEVEEMFEDNEEVFNTEK